MTRDGYADVSALALPFDETFGLPLAARRLWYWRWRIHGPLTPLNADLSTDATTGALIWME